MKRNILIIVLIGSLGLIPIISFAQNAGDACGGSWRILPPCGAGLRCEGSIPTIDKEGTCVSTSATSGGNNSTPSPAATPELPVWYGLEDKATDTPKTSFLSWLIRTLIPEKNTGILKDQCSNPARQNDCMLPDGKTKGHCSGVIGENKKCVPWMYAQAPKALPQSPPPVNPATHIIPCTTGGGAIESSSDSENGVACAYKPGGCEKWDPNSPTGIYLACSPKAYQKYKKAWDDSVQATKDAIRNTGINPDQKIIMRLLASHGDFGTATDYSFDEVVRQCSYDSYKYTSPTCQNSRIRQFTDVMQKEADAKQKADQVLKKDLADCEDSKPDDLYRNQNECIKKQVCVGP